MPINPVRPQPWMPPLPQALKTDVQSNDPTQRLSIESTGHLRISGDASNNGMAASTASLSFDGKSVSVNLSGGMTPHDTFKALEAAMPEGYTLRFVHQAGRDVLMEVVSRNKVSGPPADRPAPPSAPPADDFRPEPAQPQGRRAPWMPPLPQAVAAEVSSSDPVQRISHDTTGQIRIAGVAANNGIAPSQLSVNFDGHSVSVPLNGGQTPYETFQALQQAVPEGYRAHLVFQAPHSHADVLIEIQKLPSAKSPAEGDWLKES